MQRATLIMFLAMSLIPAGDSAGKILTSQMGVAPVFVAWSRFAIGLIILVPFIPDQTRALFGNWRIWVRAAMICGGITCIQTALQTEDVANVFAAFFIGPLLSYALAAVFLREPITLLRSALIALGFAGVLLVVRPGFDVSVGLVWALAAGTFYGIFLTMSRWLSDLASPLQLSFTQLAISTALLLPFGLMRLPEFTSPIAALTLTSAACSMLGNLLMLYAYRVAPATQIAPMVYFQLLSAVALGWVLFGALPDAMTWIGLAIILSAGIASTRLR
ncbi:DMT family transporter [Sulfitobacter marinus]|nr:DMT family transporter [Sulfitobacter marinus]